MHRACAHRSHRNARARRAALEAKEEPPSATIPEVPLKHARMVLLPPLKGSRASLIRQNQRSEADGLGRIEDDDQLNDLRSQHALVAVPVSMSLRVNTDLPVSRRYCRPWTAHFLSDLGRVHYARFHRPLQVNSAVRTVEYQRHLIEVNGNAAPAEGDIASPHLTGATVDIAKRDIDVRGRLDAVRICCHCKRQGRSTWKKSSINPASTSRCTSRMLRQLSRNQLRMPPAKAL